MTRGVLEWRRLAYCVALTALLGGVGGCNSSEPDVPRAGPLLTADTRRIMSSEAFIAFAGGAQLAKTQQVWVARTLALHFENAASIQQTAQGDKASSMQQQLFGDTVAHLKAQIPAPSWGAFTRSGLLPGVTPEG